ncbi:glycosyltransferase [Pseudomonadota bacterium]
MEQNIQHQSKTAPSIFAFVLKGYPRISETFIAQEIHALEQRGLKLLICSLRHPTDKISHPIHQAINANIYYLPEYLYLEPLRVLRALWSARKLPEYKTLLRIWLKDFRRDFSLNRIRRLGQSIVMAIEHKAIVTHWHAHFMHTPGSVARYASILTGKPWSCSAHAKDIWTIEEWEKREKLADCQWLVTCTKSNQQHLQSLTEYPDKVTLVYHGLDFERFPPPAGKHSMNDGSVTTSPVMLLSVGRAVAKKGFDDLLMALAQIPDDLHWRFIQIGGGELLTSLKKLAQSLHVSKQIEWRGTLSQQQVLQAYLEADVFVLPSRISENGDRDGLPNVLMEALSQKLPCISTNVSGIPELITDRQTGILVDQRDVDQLSAALTLLIQSPGLRQRLAESGFQLLHQQFAIDTGIDLLIELFDTT